MTCRLVVVLLVCSTACHWAGASHKPTSALTYTPDGCAYEVSTPDVDQAALGIDSAPAGPPDHVHASFAFDPSAGFAINWRTDADTLVTDLLIGTERGRVTAASGAGDRVQLHRGHTLLFANTRVHEVHVCGLAPATTYFYKAGGPGAFSPVYALTTAPARGAATPFRFAMAGDARDSMAVFAQTQKDIRDAGAAFELFTGDAVAAGNQQAQWNAFFEAATAGTSVQEVLASVPFMVANGNHEGLSQNYLAQFSMPQHTPFTGRAKGKDWYSFDYGSVHFVALNDSTDAKTLDLETTWLDADLAQVDRARTPWIVSYHHRPLYSCSRHGSDKALRQRWQPLYDKYAVDLVVNGHDHQYERSKPIRGAHIVAPGAGTIYLVSAGAGAKLYSVGHTCDHTAITEQAYHYLLADVARDKLTVTAYRLDGSKLDQFSLTK